ncbi:MAG: hypothetical protein R3E77_14460 [Steroidobacteraceae bacterium]
MATRTRSAARCAGAVATALLCACAAAPQTPLAERLDPSSGMGLTSLAEPLQLLAGAPRTSGRDPFAYLGPFQTNRMGERHLYLWVALPGDGATIEPVTLRCGVVDYPLASSGADPRPDALRMAPYAAPAPWSAISVHALPDELLACLADGEAITLEAMTVTAGSERFARTSTAPEARLRAFYDATR